MYLVCDQVGGEFGIYSKEGEYTRVLWCAKKIGQMCDDLVNFDLM